jgi:hypothetical protein
MCARPSVTCSFQPSAVWTEWLTAAIRDPAREYALVAADRARGAASWSISTTAREAIPR